MTILATLSAEGYRPSIIKLNSSLTPVFASVPLAMEDATYLTLHNQTVAAMGELGLIDHDDWNPYWSPSAEVDLASMTNLPGVIRDISARNPDITEQIHGQFIDDSTLEVVYKTTFWDGYSWNVGYCPDGRLYKVGAIVPIEEFFAGDDRWHAGWATGELPEVMAYASRVFDLLPDLACPEGWQIRAVGIFQKAGVMEAYLIIRS